MTGALIILLATILTGLVLYVWHRYELKKSGGVETPVVEPERPDGCCGKHEICEKESLLVAVSEKIEYYEDEELDAYKGISAEDYTDEQIEQFRDVLCTLRPDDVAGWARSIQLRNINLPTIIQEELLLMISEMREKYIKE